MEIIIIVQLTGQITYDGRRMTVMHDAMGLQYWNHINAHGPPMALLGLIIPNQLPGRAFNCKPIPESFTKKPIQTAMKNVLSDGIDA
jgi:hypothetical protein